MKLRTSLLSLFAASLLFISCKEQHDADSDSTTSAAAPSDANVKLETASFNIEGMSCAVGCAKMIESKVAKLDGVQEAKVDYDSKTATIKFDASKQTPEKIVETVESVAGGKLYKVSNVKSSGDQAMAYGDPKKEKKKKKSKKGKETTEETKSCSADSKSDGKPGCCSAKKSASIEDKKVL